MAQSLMREVKQLRKDSQAAEARFGLGQSSGLVRQSQSKSATAYSGNETRELQTVGPRTMQE